MKQCHVCKEMKPFAAFYRNKVMSDGSDYRCKQCHEQAQIAYRATSEQRRRAALTERYGPLVCKRCGSDENLEWHHRDPSEKKAKIGSLIKRGSKADLWAEVVKCVLLCHPCHRQLHQEACRLAWEILLSST